MTQKQIDLATVATMKPDDQEEVMLPRLLNFMPFNVLGEKIVKQLVPFAKFEQYVAGAGIFSTNKVADRLFLIEKGNVALRTSIPKKGDVTLQSVGKNEILGLSSTYPPYVWHFDAVAITDVEVISLDTKEIMQILARTPLGFEWMHYLFIAVTKRLQATRLQLLNVYQNTKELEVN